MAFLDGVSSLEDVLGRQASSASMDIESQFNKKRRQAVAQQAKAGRLGSGVANYSLADVDAGEIGAYGDVQSSLAEALGQIPSEDYVTDQENTRQIELAELIGRLNKRKKGGIGSILGGAGTGAASGAAFGPWGAAGGGVLGGVLGGLS